MVHIMSGLEVNKIIAAIILAILIFTLINHAGDLIVNIDQEKNKKQHIKLKFLKLMMLNLLQQNTERY